MNIIKINLKWFKSLSILLLKLNVLEWIQVMKMKSKDKVLIVIPAYNEAENILKVIKEIKKDVPKNFDVLVINDSSKDN